MVHPILLQGDWKLAETRPTYHLLEVFGQYLRCESCSSWTQCTHGNLKSTLASVKIKLLRSKYAARCVTNSMVDGTFFFKDVNLSTGMKSMVSMDFAPNGTTQVAESYLESNNFNMMLTKKLFLCYNL